MIEAYADFVILTVRSDSPVGVASKYNSIPMRAKEFTAFAKAKPNRNRKQFEIFEFIERSQFTYLMHFDP